jgi:hypothetical protein
MANDVLLIANPTGADITVNTQTVKAGKVASLTIVDTTTDLYSFVSQGCCVAPASKTNGTANANAAFDNATTLAEKGARLLGSMVRAVQSAGSDTRAQAGV